MEATAGAALPPQRITVGMSGGTPSDYPFDSYRLSVTWSATEERVAWLDISSMLRSLDLRDRTQLVIYAHRTG